MNHKQFQRHKKAVITDLNNIKEFSAFQFGFFIGMLSTNKIWLGMNEKQYNELRDLIEYNFKNCYSIWSGKRKEVLEK